MDKNTFKVMEYVLENPKQGFRIKHNNKHGPSMMYCLKDLLSY